MNDYKELITELYAGIPLLLKTRPKTAEVFKKCLAAIEQLVKERDAAVADLRLVANNCFEDYVFGACHCCKKDDTCDGQPATGCEFEWRGVQNE